VVNDKGADGSAGGLEFESELFAWGFVEGGAVSEAPADESRQSGVLQRRSSYRSASGSVMTMENQPEERRGKLASRSSSGFVTMAAEQSASQLVRRAEFA
jgi:hypothetical protein